MNDTLISATNLDVARQGNSILEGVSLTLSRGDFTTVVGPNGAGKSMLLRCLMGFYKPDSGSVWHKPGVRIGYVPQRFSVNHSMPMSVKRFLALNKKASQDELLQVAADTAIEDYLEDSLHSLSGGQLQRVLLARACLGNPELLVLDEPAQSLDIGGQLDLYNLLERLHRKHNLAILMVSHDLHLVIASTQQVICLFRHICCSGTPQAVTQDPQFSSLFGDDMSKMLAVYQHAHCEGQGEGKAPHTH